MNEDETRLAAVPQETTDAAAVPRPDASQFENRQMHLFQTFLANTAEEEGRLSNAIDLWDNVPRYSISRQVMNKARLHGRFLESHTAEFQYRGRRFTRTLKPARVRDVDGVERDFFPGATEELVEDALRKLAVEQQAGFFDRSTFSSGVVFTLYQLREELKRRGHTRSFQEIVLALNVLSQTTIIIKADSPEAGEAFDVSTFIPHLAAVSRTQLQDDPKARWVVQFHPLVTASIDKLTYRQFNYELNMRLDTQLARWLHKQLVLKFTFASFLRPFEMRFSTVRRDSGLLDGYTETRHAIRALADALEDLKEKNILMGVDRANVEGPHRKLLDVVFTLRPSADFIRDVKAGSKRLSLAAEAGNSRAAGPPAAGRAGQLNPGGSTHRPRRYLR